MIVVINIGCNKTEFNTILCSDYKMLQESYNQVNKGLIDFINSAPDKPSMEPIFPELEESIKCVED